MEPKPGTQCDRLLAHLQLGCTINPLWSWTTLGIYRLAARICDLRQMGYNIKSTRKTVKNRFGEPCKVAEYYLED